MSATLDHRPIDPEERILDQIAALAHSATGVWPAVAVVLFTLRGSMQDGSVHELATIALQFAEKRKTALAEEE